MQESHELVALTDEASCSTNGVIAFPTTFNNKPESFEFIEKMDKTKD